MDQDRPGDAMFRLELRDELIQARQEMGELAERVDFAERALIQQKSARPPEGLR